MNSRRQRLGLLCWVILVELTCLAMGPYKSSVRSVPSRYEMKRGIMLFPAGLDRLAKQKRLESGQQTGMLGEPSSLIYYAMPNWMVCFTS